tara:strand:+ start:747 stop:908 length:162 start_codon:yes stop_codon:yes gene_type:complete
MASITLDKMQKLGFERRIHLADFLYQIHNEMMTKSNRRSKINELVKQKKASYK